MSLYTSEKEAQEAELKKLQDSGASVNGAVINAFYFVDTLPATPLFPANVTVERAMAAQATADNFNLRVCGATCTVSYKDGRYVNYEIATQGFVFDEDDAKLFQEGVYPIYRGEKEAVEALVQEDLQAMQPDNQTFSKTHKIFCFFDPLPNNAVLPGAFKVQNLAFQAPDEYRPTVQGISIIIEYGNGSITGVSDTSFCLDLDLIDLFREDKIKLFASREAFQSYYESELRATEQFQKGYSDKVQCRGFILTDPPPDNFVLPQLVTIRDAIFPQRYTIVAGGGNYLDERWSGNDIAPENTLGFRFTPTDYKDLAPTDITYAFDMMAPPVVSLTSGFAVEPHLQGSGFISCTTAGNGVLSEKSLADINEKCAFPKLTSVVEYGLVQVQGHTENTAALSVRYYMTSENVLKVLGKAGEACYVYIPNYIVQDLDTVQLQVYANVTYQVDNTPTVTKSAQMFYGQEKVEAILKVEFSVLIRVTYNGQAEITDVGLCFWATWFGSDGKGGFSAQEPAQISVNDYCRLMTLQQSPNGDYAQVIITDAAFDNTKVLSQPISVPIFLNFSGTMSPPPCGTIVSALTTSSPFCTYPPLKGGVVQPYTCPPGSVTPYAYETGLYVLTDPSLLSIGTRLTGQMQARVIVFVSKDREESFKQLVQNGDFKMTAVIQTATYTLDGLPVSLDDYCRWDDVTSSGSTWETQYEREIEIQEFHFVNQDYTSNCAVPQSALVHLDAVTGRCPGMALMPFDAGKMFGIQARGLVTVQRTEAALAVTGYTVICVPYYSLFIE